MYDQILLDAFGLEDICVCGRGKWVVGYNLYVKIYLYLLVSPVGTRDVKIQGACHLNMNLS